METVRVEAQRDFIESLCHTNPLIAVAELIWNGFDADARTVTVEFDYNNMGGFQEIRVTDDGHGIPLDEARNAFKNLGGSWKRDRTRTKVEGRYVHGKEGKGRFRAFALGKKVTWLTSAQVDGKVRQYEISGSLLDPTRFDIGDASDAGEATTGTTVVIVEPQDHLGTLTAETAQQHIAERFALYLRQYPHVRIKYRGDIIDPRSVEEHVADYDYTQDVEGREAPVAVKLTVIEWNRPTDRSLFLCDEEGFTLQETRPGIHAPGFHFAAYLRSKYFRDLQKEGILDVEDMSTELQSVVEAGRKKLRQHFRKREAEQAGSVIDDWKKRDIYPYAGEPADFVETAERQVFDVLALNINSYLPEFEETEAANKKLALRLLRHALETRPSTITRILKDVVNLPEQKKEELVDLLERTTLESIITASRVVADRSDFLKGFATFLFDKDSKSAVLERQHLQQIVARETWVFGEKYHLAQQEATLTEVLRRHYDLLGEDSEVTEEVTRLDGSKGRIDLMLGTVIPQADPAKREHLIIELKRPARKIDTDAMKQVESYAETVASDDRFRSTDTCWEFYAISNEIDPMVKRHASSQDRPKGLYLPFPDKPIRIWVKEWGEVIQECEARMHFFRERLDYAPTHQAGLDYLRKIHAAYLPATLKTTETSGEQAT